MIEENAAKVMKQRTPSQQPQKPAQRPIQRTTPLVTIDGPLGDILRETADSLYGGDSINEGYSAAEEWPDVNNGVAFDSDDVPMTMMSQIQPSNQRQSVMSSFDGDPTSMFVKDYSAVMKAADAHQGKI